MSTLVDSALAIVAASPIQWTTIALLLIANAPASAIVTSDQIGSHTVPSGAAFGVNLDGVALLGGIGPSGQSIGGQCSAALITDRHVLTAAHCLDEEADLAIDPIYSLIGAQVVFAVDGAFTELGFDINNVQWPNSWGVLRSDIAILTLHEDAPSSLPRYPLYGGTDEMGQPFVLAGFGNAGHGASGQNFGFDEQPTKRAGLNRYEWLHREDVENEFLVYDFDSGEEKHNALAVTGVQSDLGFGMDEVMHAGRDSGGPGFLNGAIASIVAFGDRVPSADVTDTLDSSWGEGGFDLRVSSYRDFITMATDGQAVFVPEPMPSPVSLLFVMVTLLRGRRRA